MTKIHKVTALGYNKKSLIVQHIWQLLVARCVAQLVISYCQLSFHIKQTINQFT